MSVEISVIFVGEDGWTDMAPDLPEERATSAHGFHKPWWKGVKLYHRNGYRYEVENATPEEDLPPLSKLLRRDDPRSDVQRAVRIPLARLLPARRTEAGAPRQPSSKDDDVLTQFHEADELDVAHRRREDL